MSARVEMLEELAAKAEAKHPELAGRAKRAAQIAALDAWVCRWDSDGDTLHVQGLDGTYHVNGTCDCKDYQYRAPVISGERWCKHRLARLMLAKLDGWPVAEPAELEAVDEEPNVWAQSMAWQDFSRSFRRG